MKKKIGTISKVNDFVLGLDWTIERVRDLGRNVVIEKEPHAAKRFSNSTLGTERRVVLDPNRQFGQPIVFKSGVRTEILYLAVKNGASEDEVAEWFEVERKDVQDAE